MKVSSINITQFRGIPPDVLIKVLTSPMIKTMPLMITALPTATALRLMISSISRTIAT